MNDSLSILVFVIVLVAIMFWIRETYQDKRELDALRDALRTPAPLLAPDGDAADVGATPYVPAPTADINAAAVAAAAGGGIVYNFSPPPRIGEMPPLDSQWGLFR